MKNIDIFLKKLKEENIEGYLLPSNSEFLDEFTPDRLSRLKWLTGFTGSNGIVFISQKQKIFFTDGRYKLQAKQELDDDFIIEDISLSNIVKILKKKNITYNSLLFSHNFIFSLKKEISAQEEQGNMVDEVWQREKQKRSKIEILSDSLIGKNISLKLKDLKEDVPKESSYICCDSASICYLLNLRGEDIVNTPLIHSYFILNPHKSYLFANKKNFSTEIILYLEKQNIFVKDVEDIENFAAYIEKEQICLDSNITNDFFVNLLERKTITKLLDPIIKRKSIKNAIEIENIKNAHILDGRAKTKLISYLKGKDFSQENLTEFDIEQKLLEFCQENKEFKNLSFPTICGFAENGAVIHYNSTKKNAKKLENENLLLIDSGGQYIGDRVLGTTDITRTIYLGKTKPKAELIKSYTLVLKGHIALATAIFKIGTTGKELDILARQFLKEEGLNYAHGTGHGVGCYLSVHEGPCGISPKSEYPLKAGMILSNEPGYYKEGEYGIRIENLVLVKKSKKVGFLEFETISLVSFDDGLIDYSSLDSEEEKWLAEYQKKCYYRS